MRRISRRILIGALILLFLSSGCGRLTLASPTPVWTVPPAEQPVISTSTPVSSATQTGTPATPQIPVTGENVVNLQCQFCVDAETHAVLIFPDAATFDVSSDTPVSCLTADVINGRRILICHGTQSTTFYLNICSDSSNCSRFSVVLQPCPLLQNDATPVATGTPFNLTPVTTNAPAKKTKQPADTAVPDSTPTPGGAQATSTPAVNTPTTPLPTSYSSISLVEIGR